MTIFSVTKRLDPHSGLVLRRRESHQIESIDFLSRDEARRLPFLYDRAKQDEVVVVDEDDDSVVACGLPGSDDKSSKPAVVGLVPAVSDLEGFINLQATRSHHTCFNVLSEVASSANVWRPGKLEATPLPNHTVCPVGMVE